MGELCSALCVPAALGPTLVIPAAVHGAAVYLGHPTQGSRPGSKLCCCIGTRVQVGVSGGGGGTRDRAGAGLAFVQVVGHMRSKGPCGEEGL